jgi:nuclease S1
MKNFVFLLIFVFVVNAQVEPLWSRIGHELISDIAQSYCTANVVGKIRQHFPAGTLKSESMWADHVKREPEWKYTATYHYANFPGNSCDYIPSRDCTLPKSCVVGATSNYTSQLKSDSKLKIKTALRFLVHLVGDLHQPLHIGRASDMGGNNILVTFFTRKTSNPFFFFTFRLACSLGWKFTLPQNRKRFWRK